MTNSNTRRQSPASRTGVSMAEMVAATTLLGVITLLLVPVIAGVAGVREEAARHQLAVLEAANLMERIAAQRASGTLSQQQLESLSLSTSARERLDNPQLTVSLGESAGSPRARQLSVEISWQNRYGDRAAPVRVVTWLYESEETGDVQQ